MTLRNLLLAALLALAAPVAIAAPPSDAEVDELMRVMRVEQSLDAMWPQIQAMQAQMVQQAVAREQLDEEQTARLQAVVESSNATLRRALTWEKLQPVYRDIYRNTFDAEDVAALSDFYSSPAGQNLLEKMPQLMQNTMAATQQLMMPVLREMQQDIEAAAKQPD